MNSFDLLRYPNTLCIKNLRPTVQDNTIQLSCPSPTQNLQIDILEQLPQEHPIEKWSFELLYGVYHLLSGPHLAVITQHDCIGEGPSGEKIYRALEMKVLPISTTARMNLSLSQQQDEKRYIRMLESIIRSNGQSFYYSFNYPLTLSAQRQAEYQVSLSRRNSLTDTPLYKTAEDHFFWNKRLLNDFIQQRLEDWITPVINGFVKVVENCHVQKNTFNLLFITRRSWLRVGTRFCVRGANKYGHVANYAETEILILRHGSVISYVQTRGSIPLYWHQLVTLKYMPRTEYTHYGGDNSVDWNEIVFNAHFNREIQKYRQVTAVNLIDKTGKSATVRDQAQLGTAFGKYTKRYASDKLRYVWFDFHHECRKLRWHNLSKLIAQVEQEIADHGCFSTDENGTPISYQEGVFRVNCMDNLDRTNVVQSLFARRAILLALGAYDENYSTVLDSPYDEFERVFKAVWADNADAVSLMYSGTGALKTDFTRTGKRTLMGQLRDGYNSVYRYWLNNFRDGCRQDALDLFVANYVPDARLKSPFTFRQRWAGLWMLIEVSLLWLAATAVLYSFRDDLVKATWTTGAFTLLGSYAVLKKGYFASTGRRFVSKPSLVPGGYPDL